MNSPIREFSVARWFDFFLVAVAGGLLFSAASAPAVAQVKIRIRVWDRFDPAAASQVRLMAVRPKW